MLWNVEMLAERERSERSWSRPRLRTLAHPVKPEAQSAPGRRADARAAGPDYADSGLDRLTPEEAARWRRRLHTTARPCGCKSGAAAALGALIIWPAWMFASGAPHTLLGWGVAIVAYPLLVVAAGVAGKVVGIATGRWRHQRLRRQLAKYLEFVRAGG